MAMLDAKAAATADTTAVDSTVADSTVADSVGAAEKTNEAAESATANSACGARHRHAYQLLSAAGGRTRGRLAWADIAQASGRGRARIYLQNSRRTVVLVTLVAREDLDVQERSCRCCCRRPHACGRARRLPVCASGTE